MPRDLIDINFQFSLRGILFESSLYMNVFEDIPLNLFSSNNSCSSQKNNINPYEISSIIKIQKLFFANIDENFKKSDPNSSNNFASAPIPPPPTTARSQATNRKSSSSVDGNRLWGKDYKYKLARIEWSPDSKLIIFDIIVFYDI